MQGATTTALGDKAPCANQPPAQTVCSPAEIAHWLAQVRDGQTPVSLLNVNGQGAVSSSLCAVDAAAGRLCFIVDTQDPAVQQLLQNGQAVAVTEVDRVGIEFEVQAPLLVHSARGSSLQAAFPRSLGRHQRRDSFRVQAVSRSATRVQLRHPQQPAQRLSLRVLDISIGGCSLLLAHDQAAGQPVFETGMCLQATTVELGLDTRFNADLSVRAVASVAGTADQRLGCEWQRIDGAAQRKLQRYIDDAQRLWRLRASA